MHADFTGTWTGAGGGRDTYAAWSGEKRAVRDVRLPIDAVIMDRRFFSVDVLLHCGRGKNPSCAALMPVERKQACQHEGVLKIVRH